VNYFYDSQIKNNEMKLPLCFLIILNLELNCLIIIKLIKILLKPIRPAASCCTGSPMLLPPRLDILL
jgi:hypothetical protein